MRSEIIQRRRMEQPRSLYHKDRAGRQANSRGKNIKRGFHGHVETYKIAIIFACPSCLLLYEAIRNEEYLRAREPVLQRPELLERFERLEQFAG